jgi:hypothetical protein
MILASCSGMLIVTSLHAHSFQINSFVKECTENSSYFRKANLLCYMFCFVFNNILVILYFVRPHVFLGY